MVQQRDYAVITGASQGIGAAIAREFAESFPDLDLALVARNSGRLETVASECRAFGARTFVYPCDLTSEKAVSDLCTILLDRNGVPNVVVNNAGSFEPGGIVDTRPETFRQQLEVNLTSAFYLCSGLMPSMMDNGRGHVFFVASVASLKGYPGGLAYCAAKHGLLGLARAIREETKESGVRVTTVLPGATLTATWDGTNHPDDRFMKADDVARTIAAAYRMSERTVVEEIILRPQLGDL